MSGAEAGVARRIDLDPLVVHAKLVGAFGITYRLDVAEALGRRGLIPSSRFFRDPHNHNEGRPPKHWSDGIYIADYYTKDVNGVCHRVLVSFYDEGEKKSSGHTHHGKIREKYIIVRNNGESSLLLNHAEAVRLENEFVVEPETWHEFRKTGGPVLLIIDMEGAEPGTEAFQHDHGNTQERTEPQVVFEEELS